MRGIRSDAELAASAAVPGSRVDASRFAGGRLALVLDDPGGWEGAARCRSEAAALFFGPNRFEPKQERVEREEQAKAICGGCPVLVQCREHALAHAEPYGVWGGLGEADRRAMLAARRQVARAG